MGTATGPTVVDLTWTASSDDIGVSSYLVFRNSVMIGQTAGLSFTDNAAVPGTSIHGWGRAIDFQDAGGYLRFGSAGYQWLQANAWRWGFVHPAWAEPGGSSPEPWHWESG